MVRKFWGIECNVLKIKNLSGEDMYRGLKETCRTHQVSIFPVWKKFSLLTAYEACQARDILKYEREALV